MAQGFDRRDADFVAAADGERQAVPLEAVVGAEHDVGGGVVGIGVHRVAAVLMRATSGNGCRSFVGYGDLCMAQGSGSGLRAWSNESVRAQGFADGPARLGLQPGRALETSRRAHHESVPASSKAPRLLARGPFEFWTFSRRLHRSPTSEVETGYADHADPPGGGLGGRQDRLEGSDASKPSRVSQFPQTSPPARLLRVRYLTRPSARPASRRCIRELGRDPLKIPRLVIPPAVLSGQSSPRRLSPEPSSPEPTGR